jgi:hypothetical protein
VTLVGLVAACGGEEFVLIKGRVISLPAHPHAAYISLTLKYFEENLMMATSGRNM